MDRILSALLTGDPEPKTLLDEIVPTLRWLCIAPVPAPTIAQLRALQAWDPYTGKNLLEVRRALVAGAARLGPFPEGDALVFGEGLLEPADLHWCLETLTPEERAEYELPEFLRHD